MYSDLLFYLCHGVVWTKYILSEHFFLSAIKVTEIRTQQTMDTLIRSCVLLSVLVTYVYGAAFYSPGEYTIFSKGHMFQGQIFPTNTQITHIRSWRRSEKNSKTPLYWERHSPAPLSNSWQKSISLHYRSLSGWSKGGRHVEHIPYLVCGMFVRRERIRLFWVTDDTDGLVKSTFKLTNSRLGFCSIVHAKIHLSKLESFDQIYQKR